MADNTQLNPGEGGDIAAADDIGGVKYQRVKLTLGDDGVNGGDVSAANPIPSADATAQATLAAIQTLSDTMLYMLSAILEKMPRVTGSDQMAVSIEGANLTSSTLTQVTTVSNLNTVSTRSIPQITESISQMGALHLYQNITVS